LEGGRISLAPTRVVSPREHRLDQAIALPLESAEAP
jgi:hypothetical protein